MPHVFAKVGIVKQQHIECHVAFDEMGSTAIYHPAIGQPVRIAHLTDLHVLPDRLDGYDSEFADFIRWQSDELANPNAGVAAACAKVAAACPDLVLVGGDIVDFIDDRAIDYATKLIAGIGAPALYCMGNHERPWSISVDRDLHFHERPSGVARSPRSSSSNGKIIQLSQQPIEKVLGRLDVAMNPFTGSADYSVIHGSIRILVLDSSQGELSAAQSEWAASQVQDDLPFLILTHVPFPISTLVPRIRILAGEVMLGHILDNAACQAIMKLARLPTFLGALTGHIHARSEDVLGNSCQLLTQPAAFGGYRVVDLLPVCAVKVLSPTSMRVLRRSPRNVQVGSATLERIAR